MSAGQFATMAMIASSDDGHDRFVRKHFSVIRGVSEGQFTAMALIVRLLQPPMLKTTDLLVRGQFSVMAVMATSAMRKLPTSSDISEGQCVQ